MQNVFDAAGDSAVVLVAANEEFPGAQVVTMQPENNQAQVRGWSAYEIWHSRIRPRPGVPSLFLPQS